MAGLQSLSGSAFAFACSASLLTEFVVVPAPSAPLSIHVLSIAFANRSTVGNGVRLREGAGGMEFLRLGNVTGGNDEFHPRNAYVIDPGVGIFAVGYVDGIGGSFATIDVEYFLSTTGA